MSNCFKDIDIFLEREAARKQRMPRHQYPDYPMKVAESMTDEEVMKYLIDISNEQRRKV